MLLTVSVGGRNQGLLRAVAAARAGGIATWCLTGPAPNPLADACDEAVCVYPAGARALSLTATVQEAHHVALYLIFLSFGAAAAGPEAGPARSGHQAAGPRLTPVGDEAPSDAPNAPEVNSFT